MKRLKMTLLILALLLMRSSWADTLLIAAGAGYKRPVSELAGLFEKKTGTRVEQIYGHMGGIVTQARQSGKVAVIFGDLSFLEKLEDLSFSAFLPVGDGRLVLAWPSGKRLQSIAEIHDRRFARIALPDPKAAIYGIAATEYLQRSGLDSAVRERLQVVSTVPQVSAYLITGDIDAGFINLTEALAIKERIGGYLEVEQKYYAPVRIVAGVVKGFEDLTSVKALQAFLGSDEARQALKAHGL